VVVVIPGGDSNLLDFLDFLDLLDFFVIKIVKKKLADSLSARFFRDISVSL